MSQNDHKYAAFWIINVTLVPFYQFSIQRPVYIFTKTQIAVRLPYSISATHLGDPVFHFEHTRIK